MNYWPCSKFSHIFQEEPPNCGTRIQTTQNLNKTKTLWQQKRNSRTKISVRTLVLEEVALRHPIIFDIFNLCDMHDSGKLHQLSVAMLPSICEHFDIEEGNIKGRRKASYLSLLGEFLESCDCRHLLLLLWLIDFTLLAEPLRSFLFFHFPDLSRNKWGGAASRVIDLGVI